jgi:hypothetical protein
MEPIYEEEYKEGITIQIFYDDDPGMNPVEDYDMLGKQVYWHSRRNLGHCYNETNKMSPEEWLKREVVANCWKHLEKDVKYNAWADEQERDGYNADIDTYIENDMPMEDLYEAFEKYNLVIPVHAYEHGGITISASGIRAGWDSFDSGQLGFVYVSHEDIKKDYNVKRITEEVLDKVATHLISEVNEYDSYLRGEIYGYKIIDTVSDEELDSCWGFIGEHKYCLEEARNAAEYWYNEKQKELELLDQRMTS